MDDITKIALSIIAGAVVYVVNQAVQRRTTRKVLLVALKQEARMAKGAVANMLVGIKETEEAADKIVSAVDAGSLPFDLLHELYSGWVIYVPTYPLLDTVTKLGTWNSQKTRDEIEAVIRYFDLWNTVAAVEKSYSIAHAKLVELSAKIEDENERTRIRETARQTRGCLRLLVKQAGELLDAASRVEQLLL